MHLLRMKVVAYRKHLMVIAVISALTVGQQANAQIPVTVTTQASDSPMTIAEFAENVVRWSQQYEQMTSQLDQMKEQYSAITGSRGMGQIYNDPSLRDYLPQDWQSVYDSVRQGGYSGLNGRASEIYSKNQVFDACKQFVGDAFSEQRAACEAQAVKPSQDKAFSLDAYDQAKRRLGQLDQLMEQINQTKDPKAIAELQGRIAAEQAMIQNEQTKLQMYQMVADAETKIQEQRQRELDARELAKRGWLRPRMQN